VTAKRIRSESIQSTARSRSRSALRKSNERRWESESKRRGFTGTDHYEHDSREPAKEAQLKDSEGRLRRGEARLVELDRHIARLNHLRGAIIGDIA
jgi:hypothetical protein